MRACVMIEGQQGVAWRDWCELADACEQFGFEGLFRSDHYFSARGVSGRGSTDAWTLLGGLAARTSRIRLGTLVSPVTFRQPALLAKAATTVDEISDGRVEVGMGAGWWEEEHTQFGFPFFDVHERWARLEEAVQIVHCLWTEDRFSFDGKYYRLDAAEFLPKPVQRPHPPLILGGKAVGPRMQRLVGRYADEFNTVGGTPDDVAGRFARARAGFEAEGRDPSSLVTSMMTWFFVGRTEDEYFEKLRRAHAIDPDAGSFEDYRVEIERDCIVGSSGRAVARLREYADAGVQRMFLNLELYDDLEMLELVANDVLPRLDP
ncbi:MAG: TIGR03560 family F420-dependent LLM class oxidoreductase [Actinobacteria bacterium]|nr:MAG: TIGR03560 family F420-dependent LLM class oxidoreductase [Actinomycetota bacterium]